MKRAATRLAAVLSAGAMMCVVAAPAAAQTGSISGAPGAGGTPLIGVNVAIGEVNALNDLTANVTLQDVLNDAELDVL